MINKYFIQHKKFKKPIIVGYNEWGVLCFYDGIELDKEQSLWFKSNLPIMEEMIPGYTKKYTSIQISKATIDTSFEAAYEAYNCKVGKKEKARILWDKLPEGER